jgi:hypothetical protein
MLIFVLFIISLVFFLVGLFGVVTRRVNSKQEEVGYYFVKNSLFDLFVLSVCAITIFTVLLIFIFSIIVFYAIITYTGVFTPIEEHILEQTKNFLVIKNLYDNDLLITNQLFISNVVTYQATLTNLLNITSLPQDINFQLHIYNTAYLILFKSHYFTQFFYSIFIKFYVLYLLRTTDPFIIVDYSDLPIFYKYIEIIVDPQYYEAYLIFYSFYE